MPVPPVIGAVKFAPVTMECRNQGAALDSHLRVACASDHAADLVVSDWLSGLDRRPTPICASASTGGGQLGVCGAALECGVFAGLYEPCFVGVHDGLGAVTDAEFSEDAVDVGLDRAGAEVKVETDLSV